MKDFNIMEKAGGAGKGHTETFDVFVNGSTLEVHLYWAGKGTTNIPEKGVYGPLISAITVTPSNLRLLDYCFYLAFLLRGIIITSL